MNLVASLLKPEYVLVDVEAVGKKRLFELVAQHFHETAGLPQGQVFDSLFSRERLGSTGLGQGVAVPHGRIKGLHEAVGGVIRLKAPIEFDAPDGQPVHLLFVLLVPEQATDLHLQILSEIAQLLSSRKLRDALAAAPTAATVFQIIRDWVPDGTDQHPTDL